MNAPSPRRRNSLANFHINVAVRPIVVKQNPAGRGDGTFQLDHAMPRQLPGRNIETVRLGRRTKCCAARNDICSHIIFEQNRFGLHVLAHTCETLWSSAHRCFESPSASRRKLSAVRQTIQKLSNGRAPQQKIHTTQEPSSTGRRWRRSRIRPRTVDPQRILLSPARSRMNGVVNDLAAHLEPVHISQRENRLQFAGLRGDDHEPELYRSPRERKNKKARRFRRAFEPHLKLVRAIANLPRSKSKSESQPAQLRRQPPSPPSRALP